MRLCACGPTLGTGVRSRHKGPPCASALSLSSHPAPADEWSTGAGSWAFVRFTSPAASRAAIAAAKASPLLLNGAELKVKQADIGRLRAATVGLASVGSSRATWDLSHSPR